VSLFAAEAAAFAPQRSATAASALKIHDPRETFPADIPDMRVEGGKTLRTYKIPPGAERCQMIFRTNGRPMKARAQLWLGPLRQVHNMEIDLEDGLETPYHATIKFKPGVEPTLKVSTTSTQEFPLIAQVTVPTPERNKELKAITEGIWDTAETKIRIQGGGIGGGGGAVRIFPIDDRVERVQLLFWSKEVGKKSLKAKIEMLQGPNNLKQSFDLQCGGGSQPYHAIIETPGPGWIIRIYNKKFVEDGLFEVAVVPFSNYDLSVPSPATSNVLQPMEQPGPSGVVMGGGDVSAVRNLIGSNGPMWR